MRKHASFARAAAAIMSEASEDFKAFFAAAERGKERAARGDATFVAFGRCARQHASLQTPDAAPGARSHNWRRGKQITLTVCVRRRTSLRGIKATAPCQEYEKDTLD
jgi:hypothetical protein